MTYTVIKGYTGRIGKKIVRMVADHPDMEFVGGLVHSEDKDGMDLGEVAGIEPLGVPVTRDVDAICAIDADVVLLNMRGGEGVADWDLVERLLRSGKNVITNGAAFYMKCEPEFARIDAAARAGTASIVGAGNTPGIVNEAMPLFLAGFTGEIKQIFCKEATYPISYFRPPPPDADPFQPLLGIPFNEAMTALDTNLARSYHWYYRQPAHQVANAFGMELDECVVTDMRIGVVEKTTYVPELDYTFEAGTVGGYRSEHTGYVNGEPWYTYQCENVWVLGLDGMRQNVDDPEFIARVEGNPSLEMAVGTLPRGGQSSSENVLAINAARMIDLVPFVVSAEPGCRSILEAPFLMTGWASAGNKQYFRPVGATIGR